MKIKKIDRSKTITTNIIDGLDTTNKIDIIDRINRTDREKESTESDEWIPINRSSQPRGMRVRSHVMENLVTPRNDMTQLSNSLVNDAIESTRGKAVDERCAKIRNVAVTSDTQTNRLAIT